MKNLSTPEKKKLIVDHFFIRMTHFHGFSIRFGMKVSDSGFFFFQGKD